MRHLSFTRLSRWRGCRRQGLVAFGACLMGGEGGGRASQIGRVVACIIVGSEMDGGGLLMSVGPRSLPCSDEVPRKGLVSHCRPRCAFGGGMWQSVTSADLPLVCGLILWPKCNRGSSLCSAVSEGVAADADGFHPSASPEEDSGPSSRCRSFSELGKVSRLSYRWSSVWLRGA
jgi:hypothetical protein